MMKDFVIKIKTPVRPKYVILKQCCDTFVNHVNSKNDMLEVMCNIPFDDTEIEPTVYIFNDGGHGGSAAIKYCPFCGTKIETRIQRDTERLV
jgi:hypothetical protein